MLDHMTDEQCRKGFHGILKALETVEPKDLRGLRFNAQFHLNFTDKQRAEWKSQTEHRMCGCWLMSNGDAKVSCSCKGTYMMLPEPEDET